MSNKNKWPFWGNCCHLNNEEILIVSDNAILIDGVTNLDKKELVLREENVIAGTKLFLSYISLLDFLAKCSEKSNMSSLSLS